MNKERQAAWEAFVQKMQRPGAQGVGWGCVKGCSTEGQPREEHPSSHPSDGEALCGPLEKARELSTIVYIQGGLLL